MNWARAKAMRAERRGQFVKIEDEEEEDEEPFISLGEENEDDCFGIFSPVKHFK